MKRKAHWLDAYTTILFWILLIVLTISIVTTLFAPYLKTIEPFSIDLSMIYVFILLIIIPISKRIISIKYKEYEIKLAEERKEKEKKKFTQDLEPFILEDDPSDNKLRLILSNKHYFEGFGFYYKKLEEILKQKLSSLNISFNEGGGLGYLYNLASSNKLIDSMSKKRLALFIEARNKFVHSSGELDLEEEQLKNILILVSHLVKDLKVKKNG